MKKHNPVLRRFARKYFWKIREVSRKLRPFPGSDTYWENRYAAGGNSGDGSYGMFATFKAEIINAFVAEHDVASVIEFGCGDGSQLILMTYPQYIGVDVSPTVISQCKKRFAADDRKSFTLMGEYDGQTAELSLSLDVIYHLVEDEVFEGYMRTLFEAAMRYVIVYSSNLDEGKRYLGVHVRHRTFTKWIEDHAPEWHLKEHIPNRYPYEADNQQGSFADFFIFEK